jgi:hypothetical protein
MPYHHILLQSQRITNSVMIGFLLRASIHVKGAVIENTNKKDAFNKHKKNSRILLLLKEVGWANKLNRKIYVNNGQGLDMVVIVMLLEG